MLDKLPPVNLIHTVSPQYEKIIMFYKSSLKVLLVCVASGFVSIKYSQNSLLVIDQKMFCVICRLCNQSWFLKLGNHKFGCVLIHYHSFCAYQQELVSLQTGALAELCQWAPVIPLGIHVWQNWVRSQDEWIMSQREPCWPWLLFWSYNLH